jgi:hypothetical protein
VECHAIFACLRAEVKRPLPSAASDPDRKRS